MLNFSVSTFSQIGFLKQQDEIFSSAINQEMCLRIGISSDKVDCDLPGQSWKLPSSDTLYFLDAPVILTEFERKQFELLLFPEGKCDRFFTLASLCDLYFPLFSKKLNARGLHKDFRWMPLVLSGCNSSYKSPTGTAGLWAMDYLVARKNHLRVDKVIDERCGGDFTTDAATAHLMELYNLCDANNLEMLYAYIHGAPALNQIKRENNVDVLTLVDQYTASRIKLLAYIKSLMESARIQNRLQNYFDLFGEYDGVFCESDISFEAVTSLMGIDSKELTIWNPVYCGNMLIGGYRKMPFMINVLKIGQFNLLRDSLSNWQPLVLALPQPTEPIFIYYKVKRGDSIGKIAERYKISVGELKRLNGLKGSNIQQGKTLKIPVKQVVVSKKEEGHSSVLTDLVHNLEPLAADSVTNIIAQDPKIKKIPTKPEESAKKITYVVKNGDSLWKIAQKYKGVTEKDIMKWNKIGTNLKPGQRLIIYPDK